MKLKISLSASSVVANAICTAASVSLDLNGMAVIDACNQIKQRLAPLFEEMPGIAFRSLVDILTTLR